ncbi:hypothetical protein PRIPAC_94119 [Pristionchus pacificus]|uniref:Uncharacterized protein n=1 Tax=Pristionchus pacificus TaxID=54126 RepID=A0A2A6BIH5_PRIPA|nr:hypothetical protein PRIPAC_94119 [Pristionchus pacificus]|eukprot:PDM65710.1 hypothetical protein PRIPAC_45624 [Pristionchus pacificus]
MCTEWLDMGILTSSSLFARYTHTPSTTCTVKERHQSRNGPTTNPTVSQGSPAPQNQSIKSPVKSQCLRANMAARGTAITASEKKTRPRTAPWTFGSRSLGIRSSMIEERWKEPTIDRFRRVAGYGRRGNRSIGTGLRRPSPPPPPPLLHSPQPLSHLAPSPPQPASRASPSPPPPPPEDGADADHARIQNRLREIETEVV